MQVYHGSYTKIVGIDLSKAQANKDFGRGFYVTKFRRQAKMWADIIGNKHETQGFVTEFKFYERAFVDDKYKTLRFLILIQKMQLTDFIHQIHFANLQMKLLTCTKNLGKRFTIC